MTEMCLPKRGKSTTVGRHDSRTEGRRAELEGEFFVYRAHREREQSSPLNKRPEASSEASGLLLAFVTTRTSENSPSKHLGE